MRPVKVKPRIFCNVNSEPKPNLVNSTFTKRHSFQSTRCGFVHRSTRTLLRCQLSIFGRPFIQDAQLPQRDRATPRTYRLRDIMAPQKWGLHAKLEQRHRQDRQTDRQTGQRSDSIELTVLPRDAAMLARSWES